MTDEGKAPKAAKAKKPAKKPAVAAGIEPGRFGPLRPEPVGRPRQESPNRPCLVAHDCLLQVAAGFADCSISLFRLSRACRSIASTTRPRRPTIT